MRNAINPGPLRLTLLAFLVIFILNILCPRVIPISYVATVGYAGLLLVWGISVSFRIMVRNLRFYLLTGAILTTSLFVMRWFRWNSDSALASRYLWYLMYVPFLFVPLLSFFAALSTVHRDKERPVGRFIVLLPIGVILLLLVLTNDLTGIIFTVRQVGDKISHDYKPMYYILVAWEILHHIIETALTVHVTNVLRHAGGTKAFVETKKTHSGNYILELSNDGFHPEGPIIETGGLLNLRREVEQMGGTMEIESVPEFKLRLTLPTL